MRLVCYNLIMSRIARAIAVGFPHHIVNRGNNKTAIFFEKEDYEKFLMLLKMYAKQSNALILAYCLMTNHVHLLVKPLSETSMAKMMQCVTQAYAKYFNKKQERSGRFWENRYFSCIVDCDRYLWTVTRYIEQNPRRANLVIREEDYPYSSARAHILGEKNSLLGEELFTQSEREDYIKFIRENIPEEGVNDIRYSTKTGRPFGGNDFVKKLELMLNRDFILKAPGRPKSGNRVTAT